jgi:hypothetical protein
MKQRQSIYYSEAQKAVMWEQWKKGESLHQIAQLFDETTHRYSAFLPRLVAFGLRRGGDQAWHCHWLNVKKYHAR